MKAAVMHVFLLFARDGLSPETAGLLRSFNRQIGSSDVSMRLGTSQQMHGSCQFACSDCMLLSVKE